jgi:hypothetical protein
VYHKGESVLIVSRVSIGDTGMGVMEVLGGMADMVEVDFLMVDS